MEAAKNATQLQQVRELFERLVDLDADKRRVFLDASGAPPAVIEEVNQLLTLVDDKTSQVTRAIRPIGALLGLLNVPPIEPNTRLGAWELLSLLGEGGMGQVFLARRADGHFEQSAAIKVIGGVASALAQERLTQERQLLAKLTHPHIARLLDGGATPHGQPFLVMEYVQGESIDAYCQRQHLDAGDALTLFYAVCDAVEYAHQHFIIHCDLKPSNIMVEAGGRVVLLDFGIANLLGTDSELQFGGKAYTPKYASPEQRAGGSLGIGTDIYSLGLILEQLLPGPLTFELKAIIKRACAELPLQRYGSARELAEDLRRYRQNFPVLALPRSWHYVGAKLIHRRWPWLLTSSVFAIALAGMGVRIVSERDTAQIERDRAVAAQSQAQTSEQHANLQRQRAQASEADAIVKREIADAASRQAKAEALRASFAERVAKNEAEVSTAQSTFFAQVFSDFSSVHHLNASSTLKDLINAAKTQFSEGKYAQGNLDAKYKIAELLNLVYSNIGDAGSEKQMLQIMVETLQSMQKMGIGSEPRNRRRLAIVYNDLSNLAVNAGETAEAVKYAKLFSDNLRADDILEMPAIAVTARLNALILQSTPATHERTSEQMLAVLATIPKISNVDARQAVSVSANKMVAIFHAKSGNFEKALLYIERALADFPKQHSSVDTLTDADLGSLLLEQFTYLVYLQEVTTADKAFQRLEELLKEKETGGDSQYRMAKEMYRKNLLVQLRFEDVVQNFEANRTDIVEKYGALSPRHIDTVNTYTSALGGADRVSEAINIQTDLIARASAQPNLDRIWLANANVVLARLLLLDGQAQGALKLLEDVGAIYDQKLSRTALRYHRFSLDKAQAHFMMGQTAAAEVCLRSIPADGQTLPHVDRASYFLRMAELAAGKGEVDRAFELLDRYENLMRRADSSITLLSVLAPVERGRMLARLGRIDEAKFVRDHIAERLRATGYSSPVRVWAWRQFGREINDAPVPVRSSAL